ncbi:MAG TPA: hypothetical protein VF103_03615 [Polyangiaceae bacterium]
MNISRLGCRLFATLAVVGTFVFSAGGARAASTTPDDVDATDESKPKPLRPHQLILGAQAFWAVDKVMPGFVLRLDLHERVWLDIEGGFVFVTNPPPGNDSLVGSPFGTHVLVAPLRTRKVELGAGLGADVHYLWGVNGDIVEVALALLVSAHYWVTPKLALFGSARVYPVHTSGLDLGEFRDGSRGLPVMFATGVALSIL